MIEYKLIKLIESLNRIMATWERLILRRTILNLFTLILFVQIIITTIAWIIGKEISNIWLGVMTIEFGAWGTMIGFYFSERHDDEREKRRNR